MTTVQAIQGGNIEEGSDSGSEDDNDVQRHIEGVLSQVGRL
jgi:hypothetical protein